MEIISFTVNDKFPKYEGQFKLRYPTLADLEKIGVLHSIDLQKYGNVKIENIETDTKMISYIFTAFDVLKIEVPEWWNKEKLTNYDVMLECYSRFMNKMEEIKKKSMSE